MQLPAEQQALLTALLPQLRRKAGGLAWKYFYGQDLCTAGDLLQEALLAMLTAPNYPVARKNELLNWAYIVMQTKALKYLERRGKEQVGGLGYCQESAYHELPDPVPALLAHTVEYVVSTQPPRVQQVFWHRQQGHSGRETSQATGYSEGLVRQLFHQGAKALRRAGG